MSSEDPVLAPKYAESMTRHSYGHAFYEPELFEALHPGMCGYLNNLGQWQPIAKDLTDVEALQLQGFTEIGTLDPALPRKHEWGPKISNAVTFSKTSLKAGASAAPAGIPAHASTLYDYTSSTEFGAILVCPEKVHQEGYYHRDPFKKWAQANAEAILKAQPDAKTDGFWVVTTTFSTTDVWTNAWTSKGTHVSLAFKVDVVGAGEIAPAGEFYRADSASGWNHNKAEGEEKLVVFFSGLHFKYRWLPFGLISLREVRGEEPIVVTDPEDPNKLYQFEVEGVGIGKD